MNASTAGGAISGDSVEAGDGIEAGGDIRAGATTRAPRRRTLESQGQNPDQREHALRRGHDLIQIIFQAELQNATAVSSKTMAIIFYTLAAETEAWARGIGSTEEVPKFGGEPGADLARLKVFVQTELARLRALQEQG